jgi:ribosomal-protein-alanine N-acetyltransferase
VTTPPNTTAAGAGATPIAGERGTVPRLQPLRWWQIPELVVLERLLFPTDSPWTAEMFWSELAAGHHYVVHHGNNDPDGPIDGYAGLADHPEVAEVQTIGVHPAAQGNGLGRALLDELLRKAAGRQVLLEVRTDNQPAIRLYQSAGFTRVGVRRKYYQPSGADAYTMQRPTGQES